MRHGERSGHGAAMALRDACMARDRVTVEGTVVARGDGWKGRYRQVWLQLQADGGLIRVTASPASRLGNQPVGSAIRLSTTLTGIVDMHRNIYFGERSKLLMA
jgi:hypothetical protein